MSERKRILFILHMPPPVHGAAVVGKMIHESRLIDDAFDCRFINLATASGLEDIGKFRLNKISRFTSLLKHIRREIKSFSPDLIYITPNSAGAAFYKDWLTVRMLKRTGTPVVAHFHNKGVARNSNSAIKRALYKSFFHNLNVIQLSERLFSDIEKFADPCRVHFCPNGIADSAPQPTERAENTPPRILFISNLLVNKGILTLLDALKTVNDRGYDFRCDIAGAETFEIDRNRINEEIKSRQLDNKAIYHGAAYGDDKERLLNNADMFVFPTFNEAFPLVCLEAMSHRLPVISTDEGGIPDMVSDNQTGFICQKQDSAQLADRIINLLSAKDLRKEMGQNGRKRFENQFTITAFEQKMHDTLHNIS